MNTETPSFGRRIPRILNTKCSGADSPAEARKEARRVIKQIDGKTIDLFCACVPENMEKEGPYGKTPSEVYFQKADIQRNTRAAEAFCEEIKNAGLKPAVYASMRYESEMYDMSSLAGKYDIWYSGFEGSSATPSAGNAFEMDAIASSYIGGTAVSGGVGKVTNAIVGTFVIMSLTNGLNLMGIDISYQYIVKGIIFIIAVAFDIRSRK